MNDPFPKNVSIEFDRERLRKYVRVKYLLGWLGGMTIFGFFCGMIIVTRQFEKRIAIDAMSSFKLIAGWSGMGVAIGNALGFLLYALFGRPFATRVADTLQVTVEGPFLRVQKNGMLRTDRKLHFRAITDYAIIETPLMRKMGIATLLMSTTGRSQYGIGLEIPGIKDPYQVRDMLAEIDCIREKE